MHTNHTGLRRRLAGRGRVSASGADPVRRPARLGGPGGLRLPPIGPGGSRRPERLPGAPGLEHVHDRLLVRGVGFSVEPGIYIPGDVGVRSEINVYWGADGPEVTPRERQDEILLLLGS